MILFLMIVLSLPLIKPPRQKQIMEIVKVRDKSETVQELNILLNGMRKMDQAYISPRKSMQMIPAAKLMYFFAPD